MQKESAKEKETQEKSLQEKLLWEKIARDVTVKANLREGKNIGHGCCL